MIGLIHRNQCQSNRTQSRPPFVDTSQCTWTATEAFGVQSLPTLLLFEDGQQVETFVGQPPYVKLARAVDGYR